MRLVSFEHGGGAEIGVRVDGGVAPTGFREMTELLAAGESGVESVRRSAAEATPVADPRLLAPIARPGKMLFCGVNYPEHAEENPAAVMPAEPFFFSKFASAVVGPGAPIVAPDPDAQVDWEVELAAVIGSRASRVAEEDALEHVFGYTVVNDVSARAVQFKDLQITRGKNPDSFCPMGPEILTRDEAPPPRDFHLSTRVNGEVMQSSSTASWLFDLEALIAFVTRTITLEPGDLITTGTPAGVAAFRSPPPWLVPGDEVTVEVAEIGALTNPVVAGWEN